MHEYSIKVISQDFINAMRFRYENSFFEQLHGKSLVDLKIKIFTLNFYVCVIGTNFRNICNQTETSRL